MCEHARTQQAVLWKRAAVVHPFHMVRKTAACTRGVVVPRRVSNLAGRRLLRVPSGVASCHRRILTRKRCSKLQLKEQRLRSCVVNSFCNSGLDRLLRGANATRSRWILKGSTRKAIASWRARSRTSKWELLYQSCHCTNLSKCSVSAKACLNSRTRLRKDKSSNTATRSFAASATCFTLLKDKVCPKNSRK